MKTSRMPNIPYFPRNEWEAFILKEITLNGCLRANLNPKKVSGASYYVWRMVAHSISPVQLHSCMPLLAAAYIKDPADLSERRQYIKEVLEPLVDRIVESVPKDQWYGVMRRMKAFDGVFDKK